MKCGCKFHVVFSSNKVVNIEFPDDEEVVFTISKDCPRHKHFFRLIGKMPGMESNLVGAIIFRQLEFPEYFAQMNKQYNRYKTRFEMILEK